MPNVAKISVFLAISLPFLSPKSQAQEPARTQPLLVTTTIANQEYCHGQNGTFDIQLKLRLHFLNQTNRKLIVDRAISTEAIGVVIAENPEKLLADIYEYNPITDSIYSYEDMAGPTGEPLDENFRILKPGKSFDMDYRELITQVFASGHKLTPGRHVLQVRMASWRFEPSSSKFKKLWQGYGDLVDQTLVTVPLPFEVPSDPIVRYCR